MSEFVPLHEAVRTTVFDGATVALEGFTHLIPFTAGHEIMRQGFHDLRLVRMTPDIIYDQMLGMGTAAALTFSWGGNPGVGSLHRLRDAIENGWPRPIDIDEQSHGALAARYAAGAAALPFAVVRGYAGTDIPRHSADVAEIVSPFTGKTHLVVPPLNPDVGIIHAQVADTAGNVMLWGITGVQCETVLASTRVIVTVEEVVSALPVRRDSAVLPHWTMDAIAHVPGGCSPSYALGYSVRDNNFYQAWDAISRDRARFRAWMDEHVLQPRAMPAASGV